MIDQARLEEFLEIRLGPSRGRQLKRLNEGIINITWTVGEPPSHVVQFLPKAPTKASIIRSDLVRSLCRGQGLAVPQLATGTAAAITPLTCGGALRLYAFIPGRSGRTIDSWQQACDLGRLVGRFHRILMAAAKTRKWPLSRLHQSARIFARLAGSERDGTLPAALVEHAQAARAQWDAFRLSRCGVGPVVPVHGDLRLANILFDEGHQAIGLLDLDTLARAPWDDEIGDLLRSLVSTALRSATPCDPALLLDGLIHGYKAEFPAHPDFATAIHAAMRISLELAARYCLASAGQGSFRFESANPMRECADRAAQSLQVFAALLDQCDPMVRVVHARQSGACQCA